MDILTPSISFFREIITTVGAVNRIVAKIDSFYVKITWTGSVLRSLQHLGFYTLAGGLLGRIIEKFSIDWVMIAAGLVAYIAYKLSETTLYAAFVLRARRFELALVDQIEEQMLAKMASLDLGRLLDPSFIALSNMAQTRGAQSIFGLWKAQRELIGSILALAAGSLLLISLDPLIGVLAVLAAGPKILRDWFLEAKRRELEERETLTRRKKLEVIQALTSPRSGLRSRLWKLIEPYQIYFGELAGELRENGMIIARFDRRWTFIVGLVEAGTIALLCGYFASEFMGGKYTYLQMGAIVGSLSMLVHGVHQFGSSIAQLEHSHLNYGYLCRMLATEPLVDESGTDEFELANTPEVSIENVCFAYPSTGIQVVSECTFSLRPGEKVALVGRNGSGKTTLLRLIAKAYLPTLGTIRIDQYEIRSIRQQSWLNHMLMATQELELPGMEAARALTGQVADEIDKDRMAMALEFSGADELIATLPNGMKTWLGEQWPSGRGFSTGQLQRLALAGAFYRFLNPKMFFGIFDEPMANCDIETRSRFYRSISRAPEFERKTILVSLHDPLYLQNFDRVLLLAGGKVVKDLRDRQEIADYRERIAITLMEDL